MATPYFKTFSLSPRGLPIPLFPTEDQRNLTHTSLSLGTKLSLARNLPRGCSLGPAKDAPGPCYIAPFCKKKKRGMSVPFYGLADIDHAISKTRYNKLYLYSVLFKVDRLQIIVVAIKYISTCRNCSSVGCLKCL